MADYYALMEDGSKIDLEDDSAFVVLECSTGEFQGWENVPRVTSGSWTEVERAA